MEGLSYMERPHFWTQDVSTKKIRVAILVAVLLVLFFQFLWIMSLNELYGLLSGSMVGLTQQDVHNQLGAPNVMFGGEERVRPMRGFRPYPSEAAPVGGKVLVYCGVMHCSYVYFGPDNRVKATFLAHRF